MPYCTVCAIAPDDVLERGSFRPTALMIELHFNLFSILP